MIARLESRSATIPAAGPARNIGTNRVRSAKATAAPFRRGNPSTTALIEARAEEAREQGRAARRNQHWVPLTRISPWLQLAVVHSEDARFFEHDGIDVEQTKIALTTAVEDGHFHR